MRRFGFILSFLAVFLFLLSCESINESLSLSESPVASGRLSTSSLKAEGRYIVVLDKEQFPSASPEMLDQYARAFGVDPGQITHRYWNTILGFAGYFSEAQVRRLKGDSRVKYIEPDRVVRLAPVRGRPGSSQAEEIPWGVIRVGGPIDGTGKVAWIIDTGVDLDHPDLNVDVSRSVTFVERGRDARSADDYNGHGTHVAGTIAAIDNDIDVVGVAAGATVVAVKVLDQSGSGYYSWVINGVDYVGANASPGDVANMSLGGPVSQALDDAVLNASSKGIYFAIAAGNDGDDANNYSPARVNGTYVYTVSAIDANDVFASFSNWGNPPIDYAAPGVSILSLWKDGGTNTISGTSMATPHVAALLLLGSINTDGYALQDPDGNPDPIAHY
ncbi:MAG: S8 family serine peptidase [Calditrichaeota bacterium]|nr:S8 family serine peptidase [Calditrichota bacterium]